jgi:hypothetical protein
MPSVFARRRFRALTVPRNHYSTRRPALVALTPGLPAGCPGDRPPASRVPAKILTKLTLAHPSVFRSVGRVAPASLWGKMPAPRALVFSRRSNIGSPEEIRPQVVPLPPLPSAILLRCHFAAREQIYTVESPSTAWIFRLTYAYRRRYCHSCNGIASRCDTDCFAGSGVP